MKLSLMELKTTLQRLSKRKFFKYGVPFLCFVFGGSIALTQFTKIRYEFSTKKVITKDEAEQYGVRMKDPKEVTLESEFEKIKKLDIDNWSNIRGPRPWEEENLK